MAEGKCPDPRRWYFLPKWESLPDDMRTDAVRPYYDAIKKHRVGLFFNVY